MKIRVRRHDMANTLVFYSEQLAQIFGPFILTEARREQARQEFEKLQFMIKRQQSTNTWKVPLKITFNEDGTYEVGMQDEQDVLFIDY